MHDFTKGISPKDTKEKCDNHSEFAHIGNIGTKDAELSGRSFLVTILEMSNEIHAR